MRDIKDVRVGDVIRLKDNSAYTNSYGLRANTNYTVIKVYSASLVVSLLDIFTPSGQLYQFGTREFEYAYPNEEQDKEFIKVLREHSRLLEL